MIQTAISLRANNTSPVAPGYLFIKHHPTRTVPTSCGRGTTPTTAPTETSTSAPTATRWSYCWCLSRCCGRGTCWSYCWCFRRWSIINETTIPLTISSTSTPLPPLTPPPKFSPSDQILSTVQPEFVAL